MYEHGDNKKEVLPELDDYNRLKIHMESGYICQDALGVPLYNTKEYHCFNDMTDTHCYKHKGTK